MAAQETLASTRDAVDVLAVMDRAIESAGLMIKASGDLRAVAYQDDLFKARAAVAELIEAMGELVDHTIGCEILLKVEFTNTLVKARSSLARVKGGAQ